MHQGCAEIVEELVDGTKQRVGRSKISLLYQTVNGYAVFVTGRWRPLVISVFRVWTGSVGRSLGLCVRGCKGVWGMFLSIVSGGSGSQVMRVEGGSGGRSVARQQKQERFVRREGEKERVILEGETGLDSILLGLEKRVKRWWRWWWWWRWWQRSTTEAVWIMEV